MTAHFGAPVPQHTQTYFWVAATLGVPLLLAASLLRTLVVVMVLGHFEFSDLGAQAIAVITTLAALGICFVVLRLTVSPWMRGTSVAVAVSGVFVFAAAVMML